MCGRRRRIDRNDTVGKTKRFRQQRKVSNAEIFISPERMTRTSRDKMKSRRSCGPLPLEFCCRGEQYLCRLQFLEARGEVAPNEPALNRVESGERKIKITLTTLPVRRHVDLNARRHPSRRNDPQRPLPSHHSPGRTFPSNSLPKPIRSLISFNSECRTPIIL